MAQKQWYRGWAGLRSLRIPFEEYSFPAKSENHAKRLIARAFNADHGRVPEAYVDLEDLESCPAPYPIKVQTVSASSGNGNKAKKTNGHKRRFKPTTPTMTVQATIRGVVVTTRVVSPYQASIGLAMSYNKWVAKEPDLPLITEEEVPEEVPRYEILDSSLHPSRIRLTRPPANTRPRKKKRDTLTIALPFDP